MSEGESPLGNNRANRANPCPLAAAAASHARPAEISDDWRDIISDPGIDAVCIGTWPVMHKALTLAALEAGKHVLCEARMVRCGTRRSLVLLLRPPPLQLLSARFIAAGAADAAN